MGNVTVVGSFNQDLVFTTTRAPRAGQTVFGHFRGGPGGKGFNQAVSAARMGAEVTFIGALGSDDGGDYAREFARGEQIRGSWMTIHDQPTGRAGIIVDDTGENRIVVAPGANQALAPAHVVDGLETHPPRVMLTQLEVGLEAVLAALQTAKSLGAIAMLNPAPAPNAEERRLLAGTDLLTPNETELASLVGASAGDLQKQCQRLGVPRVIVTLGAQGVVYCSQDVVRRYPACVTDVVDTTGAGDAFNGALAAALAETPSSADADLESAIEQALAAAAICVSRPGAADAMATRAEVRDFMAARPST